MLTKTKIALVLAGSLFSGIAAADNAGSAAQGRPDFKAKRAELIQKFDANRDGKLDDQERSNAREAMQLERFKAMDTDGNGQLSLAEFKAGKAKMRHARGMHRGHGRHGGGERGPAR